MMVVGKMMMVTMVGLMVMRFEGDGDGVCG